MSHFAQINPAGVVINVIVAEQEFIDSGSLGEISSWIQTSYNTRGGIHYHPKTWAPSEDQSKAFRKNFAGVGFTYDSVRDAFIPPKPDPIKGNFILNEQTCLWEKI